MKKSELTAQVAAGIKSQESSNELKLSKKGEKALAELEAGLRLVEQVKKEEEKTEKASKKEKKTEKASKKEKKTKDSKSDKVIKDKDKKIIDEVTPVNKDNLIQEVISHREVKYIYPDDVKDTLSRKSYRQKVRNQLNKLETTMLRIKDQESKEYRKAKKAYNEYKAQVVKAG